MVAKGSNDGCVPGGTEERRDVEPLRSIPTVARGHIRRSKRRDEARKPTPLKARGRITEHVNIRGAAGVANGISKVMDLLTAVGCATRDEDFADSHLDQRSVGVIILRLDDELYCIGWVVLVEKRSYVLFELV